MSKHKTSVETTGLTNEEHKLKNILCGLITWQMDNPNSVHTDYQGVTRPSIDRYTLKNYVIPTAYDRRIDRFVTYSQINNLLTQGYIIQNPTSHITPNNHILPDNDTRYILDIDRITTEWNNLTTITNAFNLKRGNMTHTLPNTKIDNQIN